MSEITNIEDAIKSKKVRKKLTKEKDELELEILILQKKLEVVEPKFNEAASKSVSFEKPTAKSACKLVDNVDELIGLLHNEAKVI